MMITEVKIITDCFATSNLKEAVDYLKERIKLPCDGSVIVINFQRIYYVKEPKRKENDEQGLYQ